MTEITTSPLDVVLQQIQRNQDRPITLVKGQDIRLARKKHNMTQAMLAKEAGISQSHLSRVERGEESLSVAALINVSRALGISLDTLVAY